MKHLNKLAFVLLTIFSISCSSEPETLKPEDIDKMAEGKQIYFMSYSSSGDLENDFPNSVTVKYVEDDVEYSQKLYLSGLQEPTKENPVFKKDRHTLSIDELENFDSEKVLSNAIDFINKESNNSFENFTLSNVRYSTNIWKNQKQVSRRLTIQATKKGEESEYKFSKRKVTTSRNFYEFDFDILENSEVKFNQ